jgi:thioredoxin reductase (NADPH)
MSESMVIVGSGPAGLTAAVYAARAALAPLVLQGMQAGGQLMLTTEVENFPGFPDGVMGPELMDLMRRQAEKFGARFVAGDVSRVDFSSRPFLVEVDGSEEHRAASVIVATGAEARWLGIPGEERLRGYGVSACATCDGFFFKGRRVAVVGGGDSALEEALFLTRFAAEVVVVHRRDQFRAAAIMARRVAENPRIKVRWNALPVEVLGGNAVTGLRLRDTRTGTEEELAVEGVFVAIGHDPATSLFRGQAELDARGYLSTFGGSTMTSVAGDFAAGDVADATYRQAVTAAAAGCRAAIDAQRWLEGQE